MEGRKHKYTVRKVLEKWQLYVLLLPAVAWLIFVCLLSHVWPVDRL